MRTSIKRTVLMALCSVSIILPACQSDYGLDHWDGLDTDVADVDTGKDGEGNGDCDNIWCQEWTEVPEVYFAVSWYDPNEIGTNQSSNSSSLGSSSSQWVPALRYDIIDLRGQVIAEFAYEEDEMYFQHVEMVPGADGTFLIGLDRAFSYGAFETDGFKQNSWWEVWEANGRTGTLTKLMHWDPTEQLAVATLTGQTFDLGENGGWLNLAVDPNDPDRVLLWSGQNACDDEGVRDLIAIDTRDSAVPITRWSPKDLLSSTTADHADSLYPWTLSSGLASTGKSSFLLGTTDQMCVNDREFQISAWSPDAGVLWEQTLPAGIRSQEITYTGLDGGRALHLGLLNDHAFWRVTGPDGTKQGLLDPDWWSMRPGPMLHPDGPAFMVSATTVENPIKSDLHILAGGKTVWTIDQLKIGFDKRDFFLADVVMLSE